MKQRITAMRSGARPVRQLGSLWQCGRYGRAEQQEENQTVDTMKPDAQPETEQQEDEDKPSTDAPQTEEVPEAEEAPVL